MKGVLVNLFRIFFVVVLVVSGTIFAEEASTKKRIKSYVEKNFFVSPEGQRAPDGQETTLEFVYDNRGNVAAKKLFVGGVLIRTVTQHWDNKGRIVNRTYSSGSGSAARTTSWKSWTYHENAKLGEPTHSISLFDKDGELLGIHSCGIDSDGKTGIIAIYHSTDWAKMVLRIEQTFSKEGKLLVSHVKTFPEKETMWKREYTYDEKGRETLKRTVGKSKVREERKTYNNEGELIKISFFTRKKTDTKNVLVRETVFSDYTYYE